MRTTTTLSLGEFQLVALTRAFRDLLSLDRQADVHGGKLRFEKRELSPLLSSVGPRELADEIARAAAATQRKHAGRTVSIARIARLAIDIAHARTALDALRAYYELVDLPDDATDRGVHFSADRLRVYVTVESPEAGSDYVTSISAMCGGVRATKQTITAAEQAALDVADWQLRSGNHLRTPFACLGTAGFRDVQTCLSLADPGPDHARITAWHDDLLHGLIVHIEYIDRDMIADKERIEPYRIPASWHAARVRLRVGVTAPCTAFIGRPVFENHAGPGAIATAAFDMDLLKTAHFHASACTAMFAIGVADCKIAIERMATSNARRFMRAVAGNVLRDRDRQSLSAAFNINTPLVVDDDGPAHTLTDRYQIARKGVELAIAGGFDKVTWDGASNEVPSKPIVEQLAHEQLVELVHFAHENGLETYLSAGMVAQHMANAVYAGVDGVGIGTSMHWIDGETKLMGALKPDAIREALRIRDDAAGQPLGRAAALLARLDQMHFENSLADDEEQARGRLFAAVRDKDERNARGLTLGLARVSALQPVSLLENPILARGRRRLDLARLGSTDTGDLRDAVQRGDEVTVRELLDLDRTKTPPD